MASPIKKAIIPIAGLGTRFLPMSKAVAKEFFPLVDRPIIQYIVEEVKNAGIKEVVFVVNPNEEAIFHYFKKSPELEKNLLERKKLVLLQELEQFDNMFDDISFSAVVQEKPMGDGDAILQAAESSGGEPVASLFGDDVFISQTPVALQLMNAFETCNAPVLLGLKRVPRDAVGAYGSVGVEKIGDNLYKITKIIEKPKPEEVLSDLVIVGRHVLTPEVFTYLKKAKPSDKGEIILAEVFDSMLAEGKEIYGCELEGEWIECGNISKWLKSFFYMSLHNPKYGAELKDYLKTIE